MDPCDDLERLEKKVDNLTALVQSLVEQLLVYKPLLERFAAASNANNTFRQLSALRKGR